MSTMVPGENNFSLSTATPGETPEAIGEPKRGLEGNIGLILLIIGILMASTAFIKK